MIRRRIPFTQIAFVTLIGVGGGVYIYRPYFVNRMKTPVEQNQNVAKKESETWLPIILSQSKAGLYSGPLQLEAKLLGTWDMKFIECCLINKCVVFDLRPFNCIFIVLFIKLAQVFCQGSSWTASLEMFEVWRQEESPSTAAWSRKAPPQQLGLICTNSRIWEFSHCCDVNLHKCA